MTEYYQQHRQAIRARQREYYQENKEKICLRRDANRRTIRAWFHDWKRQVRCVKCGEDCTACLDLHHLDPKEKDLTVASLVAQGSGKAHIMREIAKCVVLCANCHRKLHGGVWNGQDTASLSTMLQHPIR